MNTYIAKIRLTAETDESYEQFKTELESLAQAKGIQLTFESECDCGSEDMNGALCVHSLSCTDCVRFHDGECSYYDGYISDVEEAQDCTHFMASDPDHVRYLFCMDDANARVPESNLDVTIILDDPKNGVLTLEQIVKASATLFPEINQFLEEKGFRPSDWKIANY